MALNKNMYRWTANNMFKNTVTAISKNSIKNTDAIKVKNEDRNKNAATNIESSMYSIKDTPDALPEDFSKPVNDAIGLPAPDKEVSTKTQTDKILPGLKFTSSDLINGFILSEVLGKPKSRRKYRW